LFASAFPPAIEVSGTPAFRGGGGGGCNEAGWYAVAVCICLLDDWRYDADREKLRRHCGHLRGADDEAANRGNAEHDRANAPVVRDNDMVAKK
jgi:hypothetical protein